MYIHIIYSNLNINTLKLIFKQCKHAIFHSFYKNFSDLYCGMQKKFIEQCDVHVLIQKENLLNSYNNWKISHALNQL